MAKDYAQFFLGISVSNCQNHLKHQINSYMNNLNNFVRKSYLSDIPEISIKFSVRNLSESASVCNFVWYMFMFINCLQYIRMTNLLENISSRKKCLTLQYFSAMKISPVRQKYIQIKFSPERYLQHFRKVSISVILDKCDEQIFWCHFCFNLLKNIF